MCSRTEKMSGKERIQAVLEGRAPDRVPWVPLIGRYYVQSLPSLGYPIASLVSRKEASKLSPILQKDLNQAEIETIRLIGGDVLYRHVMAYETRSESCTFFQQKEGVYTVQGWETPLGMLFEKIAVHHGTEYIAKHMIENDEDIRRFIYLIDSLEVIPRYQDAADFAAYIGEDGIATLTGPLTPIQELLQFKMGVERTTFALFDKPELMEELFSRINRLNEEIYRVIAETPASASAVVITYEDTSTTVISPDWYSRYESPFLDQYTDIIKKAGKIHIAHMCGKISLLTERLDKNRFAGIDSVCPPTTGDLEPGDALRALENSQKIIIGGLEPPALVRMTPEECYTYAWEKLEQVAEAGAFHRFMLCSGDSIAAGTPVENLQAVTSAVKDYIIR